MAFLVCSGVRGVGFRGEAFRVWGLGFRKGSFKGSKRFYRGLAGLGF